MDHPRRAARDLLKQRCLLSGCLGVPLLIPWLASARHGVEDAQQLVRASHQGHFLGLARGDQPLVERPDHRVVAHRAEHGHVQGAAHDGAPSPHMPFASGLARVLIQRCQPCQLGCAARLDRTELGHERQHRRTGGAAHALDLLQLLGLLRKVLAYMGVDVFVDARDLLLQRGEARLAREAGLDAVAGQGPDLSRCIRGVAELADPGQVLVVAIGPGEDAGLEVGQEHGAAGGKAAAIALAPLGRVTLLEAGHPHQGIGVAAGVAGGTTHADRCGAGAGPDAGPGRAAGGDPAGDAGDHPADHQPVSQPDQELLGGTDDRFDRTHLQNPGNGRSHLCILRGLHCRYGVVCDRSNVREQGDGNGRAPNCGARLHHGG